MDLRTRPSPISLGQVWPNQGRRGADDQHAVKHHDSPEDQPVPLADLSTHIPPPPFPDPPQHLPESARTDILTTPQVFGSVFRTLPRQEWCRLKVQNGSYAPDEPVLHIEHPPHILQPLDDQAAAGDDSDVESEAGTVYTVLEGGITTQERLLDESLGRPKRRLVPVVDIRVGKRSKVGTVEDIVPADPASGGGELVQAGPEGEPTIDPTEGPVVLQDHIPLELVDDSAIAPVVDAPMDLGEPNIFEDPLNDEIAYSPALGPRPDDILFDLSDDAHEDDDDETDRSESEVWAELDDPAKMQAFTPAPIPGDYDVSEDGDEEHKLDGDEDEGTEAIRAAILSSDAVEEEEAAANGDVLADVDVDVNVEMIENGPSENNVEEADIAPTAAPVLELVKETTTTTTAIAHVDEGAMNEIVETDVPAADPIDLINGHAVDDPMQVDKETPVVEALSTIETPNEPGSSLPVDEVTKPVDAVAPPSDLHTTNTTEMTSTSIELDRRTAPAHASTVELQKTATEIAIGDTAGEASLSEAPVAKGSETVKSAYDQTPTEPVSATPLENGAVPLDKPDSPPAELGEEIAQVPIDVQGV